MTFRRGISGILAVLALFSSSSCGGPAPVRSPEGTLAVGPTLTPSTRPARENVIPKRPDNVVAWLHVDDPDALLDLFGFSGAQQGQHQGFTQEILPYIELVDLRQPIDGVLVARTATTGARGGTPTTKRRDKEDIEPVVRLHLRDSKTLFEKLGKEFRLREDGDRIFARSRHADEKDREGDEASSKNDAWVCDFSGRGRSSEVAVCGTPHGVDAVIDWLRTGPTPTDEDTGHPSAANLAPIARFVGYGAPARTLFGGVLDTSQLALVLADTETFSIDLVRDGRRLGISAALRLSAARSKLTQDLLEAPNAEAAPPATFQLVSQDTSLAAFIPGGGAVPKWMSDIVASSNPTYSVPGLTGGSEAGLARVNAAATTIGDSFKRPSVIGYGVRIDRAKSALTSVRASSKDQEKALRTLEDALEPQLVYTLAMDAPSAERAMRELANAWDAVRQQRERQAQATPHGRGGDLHATKYAVRAAPPKWSLPKGSFFFDETKADGSQAARTAAATRGAAALKTEYTLYVPLASLVWGVTCLDEKVCVDAAKKILAGASTLSSSTSTSASDELFQRKGILCGGYLSTLVGALSMHHYALASGPSGSALNDALADIERDLNAPRMVLPFVMTTNKTGEGGTLAFEVRGDRDAFRILGEHVGLSGTSVFALFMMLSAFGH